MEECNLCHMKVQSLEIHFRLNHSKVRLKPGEDKKKLGFFGSSSKPTSRKRNCKIDKDRIVVRRSATVSDQANGSVRREESAAPVASSHDIHANMEMEDEKRKKTNSSESKGRNQIGEEQIKDLIDEEAPVPGEVNLPAVLEAVASADEQYKDHRVGEPINSIKNINTDVGLFYHPVEHTLICPVCMQVLHHVVDDMDPQSESLVKKKIKLHRVKCGVLQAIELVKQANSTGAGSLPNNIVEKEMDLNGVTAKLRWDARPANDVVIPTLTEGRSYDDIAEPSTSVGATVSTSEQVDAKSLVKIPLDNVNPCEDVYVKQELDKELETDVDIKPWEYMEDNVHGVDRLLPMVNVHCDIDSIKKEIKTESEIIEEENSSDCHQIDSPETEASTS